MSEEIFSDAKNIQNEILLIGSLYKSPDTYVSYGQYIRSKYDFADEVTSFLYNEFELMYKTFSQTVDKNKVNIFMGQDEDRLKLYKKYGGWKTIENWINLADTNDFENYYNIVKKYSLVREYERNGYPIQKIIAHPRFNELTAGDIYKLIRAKADQIHTVILTNEESAVLNDGSTEAIANYLIAPQMGIGLPWFLLNEMFRGARLGKVIFNGFLSNEGKSRNLMMLIAYLTLIKDEKFLLLSNEMDEEDLRSCLITTVVNNKCFKEKHGIEICKPEKELVLGIYRDNNGDIIEREIDNRGMFVDTDDEYIERVAKTSKEYNSILEIGKWIDSKRDKQIFFKDVGSDYSDKAIEFELRKHNIVHGVKYSGYDTLKGYGTDDWQTIKQTATKIKELMKETHCFNWSVFQLTDDTVFTDIFSLSSNNIANAKQIKHIADMLVIGKRLEKEEYYKYQYITTNNWGEPFRNDLNLSKQYFAIKVDKNRGGSKSIVPLWEIDLDLNTWLEVGYLVKK